MADEPRLCPPCVNTLKELCRIGQDARLCESYEGYLTSGDVRWVERAAEVAGSGLLAQAKQNLIASGVLPQGA